MENKLGTYTYKHPTYTGGVRQYVEYQMRVQVVGERANKWHVVYLGQHASGALIGSRHSVRKDKVRLDSPLTEPGKPTFAAMPKSLSEAAREIRLPYKDNDYED